jgi:hypothetical protein
MKVRFPKPEVLSALTLLRPAHDITVSNLSALAVRGPRDSEPPSVLRTTTRHAGCSFLRT